jgi:uncharacterized protein YdaU (DUF1376 family)
MSSRPDTWMPLYIGDYMADTMHLTRDQHGAYFLLICAYWRNGGPLVDDDGLAAIIKATAKEWQKLRPVMARFFVVEGGMWRHKRIDAELDGAQMKSDRRSKAGAEGARRRWQSDGNANGNAMQNAWQNDARAETPSPSPSPSPVSGSPDGDPDDSAPDGNQRELGDGRSTRGRRLPEGWEPGPDDRAFAEGLGLNPQSVADEFGDYWRSIPGSKGCKLDWSATFRNRCREVAGRHRGNGTGRSVPNRQGSGGIVAALNRVKVNYPDPDMD